MIASAMDAALFASGFLATRSGFWLGFGIAALGGAPAARGQMPIWVGALSGA